MGIAPVEDGLLVYLHCFKGQVVCISGAGFLKKYVTTEVAHRNGDAPAGATKGTRTGRISCRDMGGCLHEWSDTLDVIFFSNKWHFKTYNQPTCSALVRCSFFFVCVCVFWVVCGVSLVLF